jgi:hypothetical protein
VQDVNRKVQVKKDEIDLINRLTVIRDRYFRFQNELRNTLKNFNNQLKSSVVTGESYKDDWWFKNMKEADQKKFVKQCEDLAKETDEFYEGGMDDKDLNRISKKHVTVWDKMNDRNRSYTLTKLMSDFRGFQSEVRKAEKSTLAQRNMTIADDFAKLLEELDQEMTMVQMELASVDSKENFAKKIEEVIEKKKRLSIVGLLPEHAAQEFSRLNYLLDFKKKDVNPDYCELPEPKGGEPKLANTDKEKRIRIVRARAKAIIIQLQLRERLQEVAA